MPLLLSEIAVKVSYIILDSNPEASFGFVEKIVFFENLIFLSDERNSAAIYCFDTLGTYQFKISRKGRVRSEYLDIEDFDIDRENRLVLIYDREFGAMLEYDFTGKFIQKYTFSPVFDSFKSLNDHIILAYTGYSVNPNIPAGQNTLIFSFDYRDIKSAKAYLAFNEELELYKKTIGPISDVSHSGDITYIYDFYTNSIYSFNSTLTKTWSIDYGNRNIPESFWRNADFFLWRKDLEKGPLPVDLGIF
ncbi:MAG: 6-bladed beta-propeller [Marinilabiliales bacterium]|nr:6-bladed beta-propeller [Marinilabiliales bacterium]